MTALDLAAGYCPVFADPGYPVTFPITVPAGAEVGTWTARVWRDDRKTGTVTTATVVRVGQVVTPTWTQAQMAALMPTGTRAFHGYWLLENATTPRPWLHGPFILDPTHRAATLTTALTVTLADQTVIVAGGELTLAMVQAAIGRTRPVKVAYLTAAVSSVAVDGWYTHDTSAPAVFTGRDYSVMWEGTAGQIPAQGPADTNLQPGDIAITRTTSL
jgi:hypothetical protein